MILFAVVGNLLVIMSYIRDKQLRIVMNVYLLNLAIADFLIGIISMPLYAAYTVRDYWPFGKAFCKLFLINDYTMCNETVLLTLLISLDRLLLVKLGASYTVKETMKTAYIKIGISWILAFCIYGPAIISWDLVRGYPLVEETECDVEFFDNFEYVLITAICEFFIPFILLVVFNSIVYYEIKKRGKVVPNSQRPMSISTIHDQTRLSDKSTQQSEKPSTKLITAKRNLRAAKALGVLVVAFALCWGPFSIANILIAFCNDCVNFHLYEITTYLLWLKSSINPLLYAFNSVRFRNNFAQLISCMCPCYRAKRKQASVTDSQKL
ncbi:histamine H3 receptor [Patella vulgata]|uniref:histamine H3 receptor n=1 Tax=Patella vulgata TaxID=6465 RepID=UPI0021802A1F|nr:histamine H3 receptor [Patella vulgata]